MTLIITYLNQHGIVHASDSNLTSGDQPRPQKGRKVFRIPFLKAGLTVSGAYGVNGEPMDWWLDDFILRQSCDPDTTLNTFAVKLAESLQRARYGAADIDAGNIFHVAGYALHDGILRPEVYIISNVYSINSNTGAYEDIRETFECVEYFQGRDWEGQGFAQVFASNEGFYYINGLPAGRITTNILQPPIYQLFRYIWNNPGNLPDWKFRPPRNVSETEKLVKLNMQIITTLFLCSDYPVPSIGGRTQTMRIPAPRIKRKLISH